MAKLIRSASAENISSHAVEAETPNSEPDSRWALAGLSLATLSPALATSIANASLPAFAQAFSASFEAAQWIVLSYLVSLTALVATAGRLGDIVGRRRLLLSGLAVFTGASLLCGLAPTLALLIAARAFQGAGAAIMMALTLAMVSDAVPAAKRGSAIGLLGTMSAIGTTLGPSLGGLLPGSASASVVFLINVPLGAAAFFLLRRALPADRTGPVSCPPILDVRSVAMLTCTLAAYALAVTMGGGAYGFYNALLMLAALILGAIFVAAQIGSAAPLIRLSFIRDPRLSGGLAAVTLVSAVMMATLVVGPFYLSGALGIEGATLGLILSAGPLVAALVGIPAGRLVDRHGASGIGILGLVAITTGASGLALLPIEAGIAGYLSALVVMTGGYGLFQAASGTAMMVAVDAADRGAVSGMLNLARNLGLITGASVMGAIFAMGTGALDVANADPHALTAGLHATFAAAAVLTGLALVAVVRPSALARPPRRLAP